MERDFKGIWISKEIWLDTRLNSLEKCILAEIDSLDSEERGCYASNDYLAEFCQCSATKVSKAISKLIELEYLFVESFDGRQRVLKSKFTKNAKQPCKICKAEMQNVQESNIDNNKSNNNILQAEAIIAYLNEKAGTRFKPVESNLKFIKARLKDYSIERLKAVIDLKVKEWRGTKMQPYLRPETLFNATKFEAYSSGLQAPHEHGDINKRSYSKEDYKGMFQNVDEIIL